MSLREMLPLTMLLLIPLVLFERTSKLGIYLAVLGAVGYTLISLPALARVLRAAQLFGAG